MNPTDLHKGFVEKGEAKARHAAAFTAKDRYRKQVRAQLVVKFVNAGNTLGKSEQMALVDPDYIAACEQAEEAESVAGVAAVHYDAAKAWFEAWRTMESTKRAEMNLR
jgi:hypothetical protein